MTAFTELSTTPPIMTFMSSMASKLAAVPEAARERTLNVASLQKRVQELHFIVETMLSTIRSRVRATAERRELATFASGDFVLVARHEFHNGKKLCLRWRGPARITKALTDFAYQVKDLRNGQHSDVHATRLTFYSGPSLIERVLLSHALHSKNGMQV